MRPPKGISSEAVNDSIAEMKRDLAYKITTICIISTILLYVLLFLHKHLITHIIPITSFFRLAVMLAAMLTIDSVSITYHGVHLFNTCELTRLLMPSLLHIRIITTYVINYICAHYYTKIAHPLQTDHLSHPSMSIILSVWR